MTKTKNSLGFSVVEALLILVVVGILGFTGWFVWHSQKTADKTLSQANNSSIPTYKKTTINKSADAKKYLVIKEWGVKVDVSDPALANAVYAKGDTTSTGVESMLLATKDTVSMDYTCGGNGTSDPITHTKTSDQDNLLRSKSTDPLVINSNHPASDFVKIGEYYYVYAHNTGHGNCSVTDSKLATEAHDAGNAYAKSAILAE